MNLKTKYKKLVSIIQKYNSVIVAYSGGVDSSFLAYVCKKILKEKVLAVTAVSDTYSYEELQFAKRFTKKYNIKHKVIQTHELTNPRFFRNDRNRCYYCKLELFTKLEQLRKKCGYEIVFDATNDDDIKNDVRPGKIAARKVGVISPLVMAKFTKTDIRKLSKKFGLPSYNKPAMACLASRIVFGEKIDTKKLKQVAEAEKVLKKYWHGVYRVRHQNNLARIEILKTDFKKFFRTMDIDSLCQKLHKIGYKYITFDLEGYIPAGKRK